ncbi:MerR family transcriptional regulator [Lachnospiraceae bacterium ZAX-1]
MEYTIKTLCETAGISSRTLRYYDQIDLLKPKRINDSGYRIYSDEEIDRLQQILFFREFDIALNKIKEILDSDEYDRIKELQQHISLLEKKRYRIDLIINNIRKTILTASSNVQMESWEKFQGIKYNYLKEHAQYLDEAYSLYPEKMVKSTVKREESLSLTEYNDIDILGKEIITLLEYAVQNNIEYISGTCYQIFILHKKWVKLTIANYTCSLHLEMAKLYINDSRFTKYYDRNVPGCTQLLYNIIVYILS